MKITGIQLAHPVKDLDDKDIKVNLSGTAETVSLRSAIRRALTVATKGDEAVGDDSRFKNFELARRINSLGDADELELTAPESALIQKRVYDVWLNLNPFQAQEIAGYVYLFLEGKLDIRPLVATPSSDQ